jgi:hypothetical protein
VLIGVCFVVKELFDICIDNDFDQARRLAFFLEEAHHLCEEWLANHRGWLWGVIHTMRGILIESARLRGEQAELATLLETQFISSSDFQYYDELKSLVSADWPAVLTRLITKAERARADIFVREGMWLPLLTHV